MIIYAAVINNVNAAAAPCVFPVSLGFDVTPMFAANEESTEQERCKEKFSSYLCPIVDTIDAKKGLMYVRNVLDHI
jgi:hypothetical protein